MLERSWRGEETSEGRFGGVRHFCSVFSRFGILLLLLLHSEKLEKNGIKLIPGKSHGNRRDTSFRSSPPDLLDHFEKLRFALTSSTLFVLLLEQRDLVRVTISNTSIFFTFLRATSIDHSSENSYWFFFLKIFTACRSGKNRRLTLFTLFWNREVI